MRDAVEFRCASMSEPGTFHTITVPDRGWIQCSCTGENWCSHIDATLVAGERHMVPSTDWTAANIAQTLARGRIKAPEDWKGTWRSNRRWRGLPTVRSRAALKALSHGRPLVALGGRGDDRKEMEKQSKEDGWEVTRDVVEGCAFLVIPDAGDDGARTATAERRGVPVLTYAQWREVSGMMATMLADAIRTAKAA